jgi:hypothetical protein
MFVVPESFTARGPRSGCGRTDRRSRAQAQAVLAAVFRVEDAAVFPDVLALGLPRAADDFQAHHRLVLAFVAAFDAFLVGLGVLAQQLLDAPLHRAAVLHDADLGLGLTGLVVEVAPQADRVHLREGRRAEEQQRNCCHCGLDPELVIPALSRDPWIAGQARNDIRPLHASASSVSISTLAPPRAVRISIAVSGNSLAK